MFYIFMHVKDVTPYDGFRFFELSIDDIDWWHGAATGQLHNRNLRTVAGGIKIRVFADCTEWLLKKEYDVYTIETECGVAYGWLAYRNLGKTHAAHFDGHIGIYTKVGLGFVRIRRRFTLEDYKERI